MHQSLMTFYIHYFWSRFHDYNIPVYTLNSLSAKSKILFFLFLYAFFEIYACFCTPFFFKFSFSDFLNIFSHGSTPTQILWLLLHPQFVLNSLWVQNGVFSKVHLCLWSLPISSFWRAKPYQFFMAATNNTFLCK